MNTTLRARRQSRSIGHFRWRAVYLGVCIWFAALFCVAPGIEPKTLPEDLKKLRGAIQEFSEKGEYLAALPKAQQAASLARSVHGDKSAKTLLFQIRLAELLAVLDRHGEAKPLFEKTLQLGQQVNSTPLDMARCYDGIGQALQAKAKFADAKGMFDKALALRVKHGGEGHASVADSHLHLATNLEWYGHFPDAEKPLRKALEIRQKQHGERDARTAVCRGRLGGNLVNQNRFDEALPLLKEALSELESRVGKNHPHVAGVKFNQAFALHIQGKLKEAEKLNREALAIRTRAFGERHSTIAMSYTWLGWDLFDLGKHDDALKMYETALAIWQKVYQDEHPGTAYAYNELGIYYSRKGEHARAVDFDRRALAIRRKTLGENSPFTARSYNNLAACLSQQQKYYEATPLYRKALDIRLQTRGERHRDTINGYMNLGSNLSQQGLYDEAEPLLQKALDIQLAMFGEMHQQTAQVLYSLGLSQWNQGEFDNSLKTLRRSYRIYNELFGDYHPQTANVWASLGTVLNDSGQIAEAARHKRRALVLYRAIFGENSLRTAAQYHSLAGNLSRRGRVAEAESLHGKALEIIRKIGAQKTDRGILLLGDLAHNLSLQDKHEQAEEVLREVVKVTEDVFGENHPRTAYGHMNLTIELYVQSRLAEAERQTRSALRIMNALHAGRPHRDKAMSHHILAFMLYEQGKYEDAEEHYRQALDIRRATFRANEDPQKNIPNSLLMRSHLNLAFVALRQGKYAEAEDWIGPILRDFQDLRLKVSFEGLERASFASSQARSPHPLLAALLARRGAALEAWQHVENSLARALLDDLDAHQRLPAEELRELRRLRAGLVHLEKRLARLADLNKPSDPQQKLIAELVQRQEEMLRQLAEKQRVLTKENGVSAGEVFSLKRIQAQLAPHAALVGWLDLWDEEHDADPRGHHWAWAVRRQGPPVWIKLRGTGPDGAWTADDRTLPSRFRLALRTRRSNWHKLAQQLEQQRIVPIVRLLNNRGQRRITHLVVMPSRQMNGVPLETLTTNHSVSYAPSGTMFAWLAERKTKMPARAGPPTLLALGDPVLEAEEAPAELPEHGVLVTSVTPKSNADKSGVKPDDVLLSYGGRKLDSSGELIKAIQEVKAPPNKGKKGAPPATIPVEVWRVGKRLTLKVVPGGLVGIRMRRDSAAVALRERAENDRWLRGALRGGKYPPLPGARREVNALAAMFQKAGGKARVLIGADASERRIDELARDDQLGGFRYVHLATHAVANRREGLKSFLVLALGDSPDSPPRADAPPEYDGRLTAAQVLGTWNLDADLVTLSACETGLGQQQGGEGYLGFAQSLFVAGARSLVLSQWRVDDAATSLLMTRFYENLLGRRKGLEGPMSKAAALAEAKRWLRGLSIGDAKKRLRELRHTRGLERLDDAKSDQGGPFSHPYFWSGFVLIGDPGDTSQAGAVLDANAKPASAKPKP